MATLRPLRALRPAPETASRVAAVPYDVVSTAEARALAAGNVLSFLHVSRPEIDLPDGTDPYSDEVYAAAARQFRALCQRAPLVLEETPGLYCYRLRRGAHEQTGIAATYSLEEYDRDVIRKHERTRKDKEDDRTRHMLALGAQTGPVFLTYRNREAIDALVASVMSRDSLYDFRADDGIAHTIWRVPVAVAPKLVGEFRSVPLLYIADGHHRAASAGRAREALAAAGRDAPANYFLAVAFPANQLRILPYNRIVKELKGQTPEEFLRRLGERFRVTSGAPPSPERKGDISLYLAGRWYGLRLPRGESRAGGSPRDLIPSLDVSVLHDQVLAPLLGIGDVRTDKRIDFVGGIRGTGALEKLVGSGQAQAAFSMFPVTLDELMAIADAGQIMPPKSTWFEPKLRDGLLSHVIKTDGVL